MKLELQGFKTFAKKTTLTFPAPKKTISPITAIVGPNGSGKSNVSDGIRWVLGEQSLKLLRGKKSEDVIFSGSEGKGRSGFAEVSITFNNEDKAMPIDFVEVTITRRLYRDGQSEYLVNGATSRLSDIQLLLAQANVGQRSYSVVSQGMVDHILVSSPEERKEFFDDATGVKQFQIKRHSAMLKLKRTYENLAEIEMLLGEITPRLRSLKRQVSRLEQREQVEKDLQEMESAYYGTLWWRLQDQLDEVKKKRNVLDAKLTAKQSGLSRLEEKVGAIEKEEEGNGTQDSGLMELQKIARELQKQIRTLRDEEFETQKKIELDKVRAQSNWAPLPLAQIIQELDSVTTQQEAVLKAVKGIKDLKELKVLESNIDDVLKRSKKLAQRLQRPAPEDIKPDAKLVARLKEIEKAKKDLEQNQKEHDHRIETYAKEEKKVRTELIEVQRELRKKQQEIHVLENQRNAMQIDVARYEEREQNLRREMDEQMKDRATDLRKTKEKMNADTEKLYPEIQRLRYKLELIGGIDPEIIAEYEETKERHDFLDGQVKDLHEAIKGTEKIIDELDEQIKKQSEKAFKEINKEFKRFFAILFGGGSCSLVKMTKQEIEEEENEVTPDRVSEDTATEERENHEEDTSIEAIKKRIKERQDRVVGIDIQATPPGKKLKALNLLSGGERALTSIALLSAIMAVNPSPFVVLDEVDAALDEANTYRFASILEELSKLTQYIIITHNRATMEKADVLYGVTMGDEGISNLLSVNMSDIEETATARR